YPPKTKNLDLKFIVTTDEAVSVTAGAFNTTKFRYNKPELSNATPTSSSASEGVSQFIEAWGSPKIPILGIVKENRQDLGKDRTLVIQQTELLSYSDTGAISKITEMPPDPWLSFIETPTATIPTKPR